MLQAITNIYWLSQDPTPLKRPKQTRFISLQFFFSKREKSNKKDFLSLGSIRVESLLEKKLKISLLFACFCVLRTFSGLQSFLHGNECLLINPSWDKLFIRRLDLNVKKLQCKDLCMDVLSS